MTDNLETSYQLLAEACDGVEKAERELFLAKVCLLLANEINDPQRVQQCLTTAAEHLHNDDSSPS